MLAAESRRLSYRLRFGWVRETATFVAAPCSGEHSPMTLGNMRELRLHDLSALASTTG